MVRLVGAAEADIGAGREDGPRPVGVASQRPGRYAQRSQGSDDMSADGTGRTYDENSHRDSRLAGAGLAERQTLHPAATVEKIAFAAVALTLVVAGCSLAVAVGGGLVERKRQFTLLRVSGTPVRTLYRVLLLEAVVPLAAATLVTAGLAYGMSVLAIMQMAPPGTPVPLLGHVYFATMGAGLAIALIVIGVTLPLLNRMTEPDNVRFE